jgi:hypothetical protein
MSSDDLKTSAPPVVTVAAAETAVTPVAATDLLALDRAAPPAVAEPEMLVEGLRLLQERIPEFTHLSSEEKRSRARAANLPPEFIEHGLHAAAVWRHTQMMVKRSAAELRQEDEEIRRWDALIVELRAFTDGVEAANTNRKHRLGRAILQIYRFLGTLLHHSRPGEEYMRPYYENMKRAYLRTGQFRKRKKKDSAPK